MGQIFLKATKLCRKWQPTPVFLPRKSHGRTGLVQATVRGVAKSRIRLSDFTSLQTMYTMAWKESESESESQSHSIVSDSLRPHGLQPARPLCPWNSPGQHTGVGCHVLLQGIFPTQVSNSGLSHCRWILYQLSHQGSPWKESNITNSWNHKTS